MRHAPITRNQLITMENIEKYYASASLIQLKKLCNELDELEPSAIPVLQKELIKRGEMDLALSLTEKLAQNNKNNETKETFYTSEEIKNYIIELLKEGYTYSQIIENLKTNGIDIERHPEYNAFEEILKINTYLHLKSEGFNEEEIKEKINIENEVELEVLEKTRDEIISSANSSINWGVFLMVFSVFLFMVTFLGESLGYIFLPFGKFIGGLYLYNNGKKTLENLGEN